MIFKRKVNIDDLNAIATKYSKPLTVRDIGSVSIIPAVFVFFLIYVVSFSIPLSLIGAVVGVVYGLIYLLPKHVNRRYFLSASKERNRFINSLASILTNDGTMTTKGIEIVSERLQEGGELKHDVEILVNDAKYGSEDKMKGSYHALIEKNKDDRIFVQFTEQLLTASLIGRNNTDTLDSIAKYHDVVMREQENFIFRKNKNLSVCLLLVAVGLLLVFLSAYYLQMQGNYHYFDETGNSFLVKSILVVYMSYIVHTQCVRRYYDDSLQTMRG